MPDTTVRPKASRRSMPKPFSPEPSYELATPEQLAALPAVKPAHESAAVEKPADWPAHIEDLVKVDLTPTEFNILQYLFIHRRGSFEELSELIYGPGAPEVEVLRSHTAHIKPKLVRPWKIINVYGWGYELARIG